MKDIKDTIKGLIITRQVGMEDVESLLDFMLNCNDIDMVDQQRLAENIYIIKEKRALILEAIQLFSDLGKKIHAIKYLRSVTGIGLKDAKEWVDKYFVWEQKTPTTDEGLETSSVT